MILDLYLFVVLCWRHFYLWHFFWYLGFCIGYLVNIQACSSIILDGFPFLYMGVQKGWAQALTYRKDTNIQTHLSTGHILLSIKGKYQPMKFLSVIHLM